MIKIILLIALSAALGSVGQVFFKKGVSCLEVPHMGHAGSYARFLRGVLGTPLVWLGFIAIAAGLVIWLIALAQTQLSVAFPIDSLQYVFILITARIFLGEKLDKMKLAGTVLVIAGICLISMR